LNATALSVKEPSYVMRKWITHCFGGRYVPLLTFLAPYI
jgi:hypothetical protein